MSYATLADLMARAGNVEILQVADRDGDDIADPDVIASALDGADDKINAWLAARYTLPLSAVPPIVKGWGVSIARYMLHRDGAPDHVVKDYDDAVKDLRDVAAGKLSVPGADGVPPVQAGGGGISSSCPETAFTRENLEGFL